MNPKIVTTGIKVVKTVGTALVATGVLDKVIASGTNLAQEKMKNREDYLALPNVIDLNKTEAKQHLEEMGFRVSFVEALPKKKYYDKKSNVIVRMMPAPTMKTKQIKIGSLIKLYYLSDEIINKSAKLYQDSLEKRENQYKKLSNKLPKFK